MDGYITNCIIGFICFDEELNIVDYNLFNENDYVSKQIEINNGEILEEEINLIEKVCENFNKILIERKKRLSDYSHLHFYNKLEIALPNKGGEYLRGNLEKVLNEIGLETRNIRKLIVDTSNEIAILKMKESSQEEDKLLIQGVNSLNEIDEAISKLVESIRQWYTIYFPEMDTLSNNETYIKLIGESDSREDIINNYNEHLPGITSSNGADLEKEDIEILKNFGNSIKSLQESRSKIEVYLEIKMNNIAPNLKNLMGATLAAKLISHSGSIKRLAMLPSSTVQIMGAEKALFRHLKTGENPPKHGIIFQHPEIRGAKWWNRGKIARTLSLKISLAVRKDVFSKDFDPSIKTRFEEAALKIEKDNPFAPRKKTIKKDGKKSRKRKKSRKYNKH